MSPEQAEMNQLDIDTRSDIYSLGVVLYELLTGSTPLDKKRLKEAAFAELLRIIREEEPQKPSTRLSNSTESLPSISALRHMEPAKLTKLVSGELDWIVMKALEKDRNRRYETANGFAMDVQRYLGDEPVAAGPPSTWYRVRKFVRRNKRPVLATAVVAATLLAGIVGTTWQMVRANAARDNLKRINESERVEGYFRRIALAHAALSVNDLGGALEFLVACPEDLRGWEWRYLMRLCRVNPVVMRDRKAVYGVAFSPDGERLASADADGTIRIRNSKTGELIRPIENAHKGFACCVAFHPHGDHLASVGADKRVKVWDLTTVPPGTVFERDCDAVPAYGTAYSAAFSPFDPDHLAVGYAGTVTVWNWRAEKPVHTFPGHETDRISLAFSPDGRHLATGNWEGTVKLWDAVAGGNPLYTFTQTGGDRRPITALAFNPSGTRLAVASFARRVDVWDTTTGRLLHVLPHRGVVVMGVAFSREGLLASVGEDKVVRVWDVTGVTGRELLALRGHSATCSCVAFSPDGLRLASSGWDGEVRLWDATPLRGDERQELWSFEEHGDEVWSVAVNPTGSGIVSAGWGMPTLVWDAQTRRVSARLPGHGRIVFRVAWHPDGKRFASAGSGGDGQFTVKVWDATTEMEVLKLPAPGRPEFFAVAFSPDRRYLVTGRGNGAVQVWDANDGRPIGTLGTHNGPVRGVVFSPERRHLATVRPDREVDLWDATRLGEMPELQRPLRTFLGHLPGHGANVAFSPDGTRLVMSDKEYSVKICEVETGKELLVLRGQHTGDVYAVAVSPDGRWVASAGEDSSVKVWSARTGKLVRTFRGHTGLVSNLAFVDGRTLVSGSRDHTVKLWDVSNLQEDPG
jgi:WD40 repeat protein